MPPVSEVIAAAKRSDNMRVDDICEATGQVRSGVIASLQQLKEAGKLDSASHPTMKDETIYFAKSSPAAAAAKKGK